MRLSTIRGALAFVLAVAARAAAQPPAQPAPAQSPAALPSQNDPRPLAVGTRRTGPVTVDGRLDEAAWAAAQPITQLLQQQPDVGRPATERTEIRILYDDQALYVGARMYDRAGPGGVRALLTRRDNTTTSDKIALVFDPFHDRNTSVWFELNPLSVRGDQLNGDASWDPVWDGAARIDSLGWTAEFRIPLSQLRFAPGGPGQVQTWGLEVWRYLTRRNEQDMWAFWRPNEAGGPAYFGALGGLALPRAPRQIELVPYAVSSYRAAPVAAGDPFHRAHAVRARVGTDLKLNLTSSLTLDATVNPDFGQVEVDPAVVNLSAFEIFYQEKRPFFVSNASYFDFGNFNCFFCSNISNLGVFYSRRIGRAPQLVPVVSGQSTFYDAPDATTILGAAKVTGRTRSGWTVGVLDAVTGSATARFVPSTAVAGPGVNLRALQQTQHVEPATNYFLGRLRKDLRGGDTRIGVVATSTRRALGDSAERAVLRGDAKLAGADIEHWWHQRTYSFAAQVAGSRVAGDTAAIRRTEQSSAHYFQRPDRHVRSDGLFGAAYDPARTALGGYALYARVAKESGDWLWETSQNWRSPGFEVNDLAYLNRADYRWMNANVVRQWTTPGRWYQNIWTDLGGQQQFNYDGDRTDAQAQAFATATFRNWMGVSGFVIHHPTTYNDRLTRGGPVVVRAGSDDYSFRVSSDARRAAVLSFSTEASRALGLPGSSVQVGPSLTLKPSARVLLSLGPTFGRRLDAQQYVTAVADSLAPAGFAGQRYVFAAIDQRTLSLDTRLNTTFTPALTLELYAQPFLASGRYTRFGEFARPRTIDVRPYGSTNGAGAGTITAARGADGVVTTYTVDPDGPAGRSAPFTIANPDFNVRSLRGTAVLRWEYRPGSTLFAVWTQQRSGSAAYGDFDFTRDRAALSRDRPTNVFLLKATYWLGR